MKSYRRSLFVIATLVATAHAHALTITGAYYTLEAQAPAFISSNSVGGFAYTGTAEAGTLGMAISGAYTTQLPREDYFGQTNLDVFISFVTGNIPVQVSDFRLRSAGKVVNGGGNAETPSTLVGAAGVLWEYEDGDANGNYTVGETAYLAQIVGNVFHTGLTGNGFTPYGYGALNESTYVLAANTTYVMQFRTADLISQSGLGSSPSVAVTNEIFEDRLEFDYEAVPEPASMIAIGIGMLGTLRRRRR